MMTALSFSTSSKTFLQQSVTAFLAMSSVPIPRQSQHVDTEGIRALSHVMGVLLQARLKNSSSKLNNLKAWIFSETAQ